MWKLPLKNLWCGNVDNPWEPKKYYHCYLFKNFNALLIILDTVFHIETVNSGFQNYLLNNFMLNSLAWSGHQTE